MQCNDIANGQYANVHLEIGEGTDSAFTRYVTSKYGMFDIILDDASHRNDSVITTFEHLFPAALNDGGLYIVEDTNVWNSPLFQNPDYSHQLLKIQLSAHRGYGLVCRKNFALSIYPRC